MPAVQVNRPRLPGARPPVIKTKAAARVLSSKGDVKLNHLGWCPQEPMHTEAAVALKCKKEVGRRPAVSTNHPWSFDAGADGGLKA